MLPEPTSRTAMFRRQAAALIVLAASSVHAANIEWSEGELALIAPYCIDTMGWKYGDSTNNPSPRAGHWVARMGPSFWHMHHYCAGLLKLKRVKRAPSSLHDLQYRDVIGEFEYVIRSSTADFVMLPELYARIGEVHLLRNDIPRAAEAFEQARRRRPDYAPPYLHWANYLAGVGKRADALKHLREGLSHAPRSESLRTAYLQLGGEKAQLPDASAASAPGAATAVPAASAP